MNAHHIARRWEQVELANLERNLSIASNPESVKIRIAFLKEKISKPFPSAKKLSLNFSKLIDKQP